MKRVWNRLRAAIVAALASATLGAPASATVIASNVVEVSTASGTVSLVSRVEDEFFGDPSRMLFAYGLSGNYGPLPGDSNGISELQLLFGGPMDVTDQTGPTDWTLNCCGAAPPFGVSFDIDNTTGDGAGPNGGAEFYFAVPAGTAFTDAPQGSNVASHVSDVPFGFVDLIDGADGHGPIVPVPEPGLLAPVAGGLALVGARRLRSAA